MFQRKNALVAALTLFLITVLLAGCGGGGAQRILGLSPEGVVKTFITAAKADKLNEAALYVSPTSRNDVKAVTAFLSGQSGLGDIKTANILASKLVAQSGNYAVVVVTLQQENSFNINVKPVGLEKIDGEWYIVDFDSIYQNAKYSVLAQLLRSI